MVADLTPSERDNPLFRREDCHRGHDSAERIRQRDEPAAEAKAGSVVGRAGEENFVSDDLEPIPFRRARGEQNSACTRALDYIAGSRCPTTNNQSVTCIEIGVGGRRGGVCVWGERDRERETHSSIPASSG